MASDSIFPFSLDEYFQSTPIGSVDQAIGNNLYGINHRQIMGLVPSNKDTYGLTFFTRPQLNLQDDNIRNIRKFYSLLTSDDRTLQRFVRTTLDPRLINGYTFRRNTSDVYNAPVLSCPLIDNNQAFIPVLTNNLNSISGWPDIAAPIRTSEPGLYNQVTGQIDGTTDYYEAFDVDASFRNTKADPIIYLFYIWIKYAAYAFEGKLMPYLDFLINNRYDYNTRIYRLVLDKNKDRVTKIAATGAAFPYVVPTGSFFDFSNERPFNDQNKDITIRFKCFGCDMFDDILIKEFNETVVMFNPNMDNSIREEYMIKIPKSALEYFNNRGYARINPDNYELEWWVDGQLYMSKKSLLNFPESE